MENEKQIEIKISGNTCTLNYINESQTSKSRVSGQMSLNGSLANFDDLTLTVSKLADEYTPSHKSTFLINKNNINNNNIDKKLDNTNEKSKLEITYMSIFNSDQKNGTSSIKKTPFVQNSIKKTNENNINENKYEKEIKDSVIKKLNFDLCDSVNSLDKSEKNIEQKNQSFKENISKNLNERYFIHEKNLSNKSVINAIDKEQIENNFKRSDDNINQNINNNKNTKSFTNRCKSFQKEKKPINRILVDSNDSVRNNNKKAIGNKVNNTLCQNNSSSKISLQKISHIKKDIINTNYNNMQEIMNSEKYKERKEKLHKYFDKLAEAKNNIRENYLKLTSEKMKKNESKLNNKLSKINENLNLTTDQKNINKNKIKNYYDEIYQTSKKLFPQLSSTNSFNTSNTKTKLSTIKKNYYYQTPSNSNIKLGNISTSTKNGTFNSNLNTPIISNSKLDNFSKTDNKDIIMKLYNGNSSSKKIGNNNLNNFNNKINKFNNDSTNKKLERKKTELLFDRERDSIKCLLKKHNTDLKNVIKINNKKIQTILNGKNNNNYNNKSNINRISEINEFKQYIQKNQFDKELLKTIKKRGSFH